MRFLYSLTVICMPLFGGPEMAGPRVTGRWLQLPQANSVAVLSVTAPVLQAVLTNEERVGVRVRLDGYVALDGARVALPVRTVDLGAGETKQIAVTLPVGLAELNALRYSGRVLMQVRTVRGSAATTMAAVFFSPQQGALAVYRSGALRTLYGAGNFRGLPLDTARAVQEAQQAAVRAQIPVGPPTVARVTRARTLTGPVYGGGGRRFCLGMGGESYEDSSVGEDRGLNGQAIAMSRGWVTVSQLGNPLFTGFLDAAGCTPQLGGAAANTASVMAFSPIYLDSGSNRRGFVSDLNLGTSWPSTMPLYLLAFDSGNAATVTVLGDGTEYPQTVFAAATQGLERFPGGLRDAVFEWQIRAEGDNSGTATNYAPEGHTKVSIKYSAAAIRKFTIVHEYGHAVLMSKLNPQLGPGDLDYSVEGMEAQQHTVTSKEWQLAAAVEGFAHFVAAVAWNDVAANADGVFYIAEELYDISVFDRVFETNFDAASEPGQGVELDWAQFFWNYYTDTPAPFTPSQGTLVNIWLASYPWPIHEGFFGDFSGAAAVVLPTTLPPAVPAGVAHTWFLTNAALAGIIH
jgi:hypothetical protein